MSHQSALIASDIIAYLQEHEQKDLLRFITCGSVDDGKSTLIGRLLHDSELIYDDQLAAIRTDSSRFGTTEDGIDLALLVDGLQSEREQGITIDVAYRYFSTEKRKYIIADTPGHEQYTRNMATGASTAELAVILIDARRGVLTQTRRHAYITSLLGIRHFLIAVNKMDLIDYRRESFEHIAGDVRSFIAGLGVADVRVIPISALNGDNVVHTSEHMPWYGGPTLMAFLETVDIDRTDNRGDLRFPVQYVNRPNRDFRGYCGTIASGTVRRGDEIMVLPVGKRSSVERIVTYEGDLDQASAPLSVTLTLADEIDISRGDMIVHPTAAPTVGRFVEATVVWMHETAMLPGRQYDFKFGAKMTHGVVRAIAHKIDINTLAHVPAKTLELNEIARCEVELTEPLVYDGYDIVQATGSFIIIDRLTNVTVGAGMIARTQPTSVETRNVVWNESKISKAERANQKVQTPAILWFTGFSGSGKSTLSNALDQRLFALGCHTYRLDGDNIRHGLNRDLGFSARDRVENIRRVGETAKLFVDAGVIVLAAFISPFRKDRAMVRNLVEVDEFIEIFVDTPLEVCSTRDTKGLYARASRGEIRHFTGISSPYERPIEPEIHIRPADETVGESVERIVTHLRQRRIVLT
ncbi:MAG: sulfate adenylyltransferase subunit CysN [Proteobacteria bacterium]|nr:sulfate adenylyltransferase subunit CysN [Pseudomonadota bacterium]